MYIDKLYHRANYLPSLRQTVRFVCDRATLTENEKLQSKGIAMHAYGVSICYTRLCQVLLISLELRLTPHHALHVTSYSNFGGGAES